MSAFDSPFFLPRMSNCMSRLVCSFTFVCSLIVFTISSVGCGSSGNTVIEDERSEAEIQQELDDYEEQMNSVEQVER